MSAPLTAERLRELLDYDPVTGVFTWRVNCGGRPTAGTVAGWKGNQGYLHIEIDYHGYQQHRLAWLYTHGFWPDGQIDHKNGVRSDNWIDNLRDCTNAQNMRNMDLLSRTTSGFKGVSFRKRSGKWEANIRVNRRLHWLGSFDKPHEAAIRYDIEAVKHFGEFARTNKMLGLIV